MRQVQRRRAEPADAVNLLTETVTDRSQRRFHHRPAIVSKSDPEQNFVEIHLLTNPNRPSVMRCTMTASGHVQIFSNRIQDHATLGLAVMQIGDRNGKVGNVMSEICGSVEWINHPQMLGINIARIFFFTQNRVIRKRITNDGCDATFGRHIRIRHHIGDSL